MKYLHAKCPILLMEALISWGRRRALGATVKWPVSFCLCGSQQKTKAAICLAGINGD